MRHYPKGVLDRTLVTAKECKLLNLKMIIFRTKVITLPRAIPEAPKSVAAWLLKFGSDSVKLHHAPLQFVEEEIDDGGSEERQGLRDKQSADDGDAEGLAQLGADAHANGER
jgi:hypothetical protein